MRICFKTVSASCQCKSQKYLNYFFSGSEQQAGQGRNQWQFYSAIGCNDHLRKLQRTNAMGHDLHSILRTFSVKRVHVEISSLQVLIHICSRHNCFRSSTMCPYLKRKLCTNRTKQNKKKTKNTYSNRSCFACFDPFAHPTCIDNCLANGRRAEAPKSSCMT